MTDTQYVMHIANELCEYLDLLKESDDKWIASCVVFLELSNDFLEFVQAYRVGDSVSIKHGYLKHNPVFKATGQCVGRLIYIDCLFLSFRVN